MGIHTETRGFVRPEVALIDISFSMEKNTKTRGLVIFPITLIFGTVWPNLKSKAMSAKSFRGNRFHLTTVD
jgi:hypothetical protein